MKKLTLSLLLTFIIMSIVGQTTSTVNISYVMNKTLPPSYTFSTDFKGEATKSIWYFGDEGVSEQLMPTYTFKYTKNYVVNVKIIDKSNVVWYGKLEARFEGAGVITTACKALFTWAIATDAVSRTVAFTNKSTGTIKNCTWTFGDETRGSDPNPVHTYSKYGEFKVCLIIETADGCKSDYCTNVKLTDPTLPVIVYGKGKVKDLSSVSGCKWGIVIENGTILLPVEMAQNFVFKEGQYVEFAYEYLPNTNTICQAGKPVKIHKIAEIPVATSCKAYFTATNDLWSNPAMMKKVVFSNQSTGDIIACKWSFGDGTTSTELKPIHEYPKYGEYKVCLVIETGSGCRSEFCSAIKVDSVSTANLCAFDLVIKPKEQTPNTFLFYALSKVEIKSWKWSFGDGKTSDLANPTHTYEKPGIYEVTCTINTSLGCTSAKTTKFTVQAPALPVCPGAFSLVLFDPTGSATVCNGKAVVTLLDEKVKPYSGVKYIWSHGATGDTVKNLCPNKQYIVQAVIEGVCQKSSSFSFLTAPIMKVDITNGKCAFNVVSPAEGIIYRWEFGDGSVAYGSAVDYAFAKEGNYDVKLTAISGDYTSESIQKVAVISGITPVTELSKNELRIYPNPVKDRVWVDFKSPVTGKVEIDIIDMKGQKISAQSLNLNGQLFVEIQTSNLKEGIFFLRVNANGKSFTGLKFLKSK
jgi:PKD repeat protein